MVSPKNVMLERIEIRSYRAEDLPQIAALEARVQPYRPEDKADVEAMFERALRAQQSNDPRWMGYTVYRERTIEEEYDAFWVAVTQGESLNSLVGIIGIQEFRADEVISLHHPLVVAWKNRGRVAELRKLRVAPEARGQKLGIRLCQTVIEWAHPRYRTLVVNTTTP
jgi:ribosomal protein S18 acetylase RimI-like enzyme